MDSRATPDLKGEQTNSLLVVTNLLDFVQVPTRECVPDFPLTAYVRGSIPARYVREPRLIFNLNFFDGLSANDKVHAWC
jgi:hypothetical protein